MYLRTAPWLPGNSHQAWLPFTVGMVWRTAGRYWAGVKRNQAVGNTNNEVGLTLPPGSVSWRPPLPVASRTAWSERLGRDRGGPLLGFAACKTARQGSCSVCCVKRTRRVTKAYRTELPCSGNILATSLGGPSVRVQEAEGARAMYPHRRTMSLMMGWGTDSPAVQLRVASHLGEAEGHFLSVTPDEQPHCCLRPVDNWKIATVPSPEA